MFEALANESTQIIDLSVGLEDGIASEPWPPEIDYQSHKDGAETLSKALRDQGFDVDPEDFPDGLGMAAEMITAFPHTATHMDAPWHYGPEVDGEPSKTIDEVPLSACAGYAVVLDFTWKEPRTEITVDEIKEQLDELDHDLSEGEIVLLHTGADELWGQPEYLAEYPGMNAEGTKFLIDQGVKLIGTDAYGFDKPFAEMGRRFDETGDTNELFPAHFVGRDVEYFQIEKMANLNQLPRRTNIPFAAFPVKIKNGSGGWVRPVAFIE
ncbi:cyclase family protein [Halobellus rufus]|uniref:cyclase family protein n=1 Tax=Halobellus rufus TaxID=1448860 RepID=UPI000679233A|nr:cyclase family protein [Halobellus rufus]